jgi:hypothetical protein
MYQCQHCSTLVKSNQSSCLFATIKRKKQYSFRADANTYIDKKDGKKKKTNDPGGTGYETVKEIRVCKKCYSELMEIEAT